MSTEDLHGSRVLVTGGTGSIGSALVDELRRLGAREIRILARHDRGQASSSDAGDVNFVEADIAEAGTRKWSTSQMGDAVLAALDKVAGKQREPA